MSPVSETVPTSDVIEVSLSALSGDSLDDHEQQLHLAARLHVIGLLRGAQVDVAERDVADGRCGAVQRRLLGGGLGDLPGTAAGEGGGNGQPARRRGPR